MADIVSCNLSARPFSTCKSLPMICTSMGAGFPSLRAAVISPPVLKLTSTPGKFALSFLRNVIA